MNFRKNIIFLMYKIKGVPLGNYYNLYNKQFCEGIHPEITKKLLINLLHHCKKNVPYYSKIIMDLGESYNETPFEYLNEFPILTRNDVQEKFDLLKSSNLLTRKSFVNSTGGSTGEPLKFLQDYNYSARAGSIKLLFSKIVGRELGEKEIKLWGNINDIHKNVETRKAQILNWIENVIFINAQFLDAENINSIIKKINTCKPKIITAYVDAIYEIAKFAEENQTSIQPPTAIITSACKLYPFMREKIEKVFQCKVYDKYGSREFGDIACELPGMDGLWVAPWGNYVEIVDPEGKRVDKGQIGDIVITSLTNYSMPFIRYKIGDQGVFHCNQHLQKNKNGQLLKEVTGRTMDVFVTQEGSKILPGYFMAQLYFRDWIKQYQIIQKSYKKIIYRIIKRKEPEMKELKDIELITQKVMGNDCQVIFEFVDNIPLLPSGKNKYLISEIYN